MLKFVSGDLFEYDATVRINTVNCVGVMGKGVALAFKQRFPAMFKEYKEACDRGEVQPGRLHVWRSLDGTTVVNFPTKRHWRQDSRIEDVEDGLKALHEFLQQQGDVRVTLPALGCGHGGLDWNTVSDLIRQYLSDVTAEVLVFAPSASRNADKAIQTEDAEATKRELRDAGITTLTATNGTLPAVLSELGITRLYVRGNPDLLEVSMVACLCPDSPNDREIGAATLCVEELAKAGVSITTGFGAKLERQLIATVLAHDGNIVVSLPSGILDFKVPKEMQEVWDDRRIAVVSACDPKQHWNSRAATESTRVGIGLSKSVLITDVESRKWKSAISEILKSHPVQVSYIDYQQNGLDLSAMRSIRAFAVRRQKETGKPNVDHIIESITGRIVAQDAPTSATQVSEMPQPSSSTNIEVKNDIVIEEAQKSMLESTSPLDNGRTYPRRLIEVDLPIFRISAHARREKSIRHGHISTLHIWWARRPLAACRAVTCAALWPDPADQQCPVAFREAAIVILMDFAKRVNSERISEESHQLQKTVSEESRGRWEALAAGALTLDPSVAADMVILRMALLDFIADFANWDCSTIPAYLDAARRLTGIAHSSLSDEQFRLNLSLAKHFSKEQDRSKPTRKRTGVSLNNLEEWLTSLDSQLATLPRPMVVDPFAGGGSIPLEAIRIGAEAFATDLNPIPILLNKVVLEYIPKYGIKLADEVRKWGAWIKKEAEKELAEFYPKDPDGATPIAYLWARTITCEGPSCGAEVPLLRSLWLAKKTTRSVGMQLVPNIQEKRVDFQLLVNEKNGWIDPSLKEQSGIEPNFEGTMKRGSATCPCCGYTTPVTSVRTQLKLRRGGAHDARLFAVVTMRPGASGRSYRQPTAADRDAISRTAIELERRQNESCRNPDGRALSLVPDELISPNELRRISVPLYGMKCWGDLFAPRQALALSTLAKLVREARNQLRLDHEPILADAVGTCLGLVVGRQSDFQSSLVTWTAGGEFAGHTFVRQALGMVWDFCETNPWADASGNWDGATDWVARVIAQEAAAGSSAGHVEQASATQHPLPDDSAAAIVTDPPYYDAVPYAYLSDFFYVWQRRILNETHPSLFREDSVPKDAEIVVDRPHQLSKSNKGIVFYESELQKAFAECRRVLQPNGVATIVFASKTTSSWEAILQAVVNAGWIITASWPIDTEREARIAAQGQARLASSVHLVCRPREDSDGTVTISVGEWRDVLAELPKRIHEWMPRMAAEGVVGADAIFACLGPALEIYSRYSRVEKSNGEAATLREYLEFVWGAVSTEALSLIFRDADASSLEPDARLTAMWLWTLGGGSANGEGKSKSSVDDEDVSVDDGDEESSNGGKTKATGGFTLEYDAARKIAQGLGIHLEQSESLVEVKGDKARLLPVAERTQHLFGKNVTATGRRGAKKAKQKTLFEELDEAEAAEAGWTTIKGPPPGSTTLDRVHQAMILFAANRGELLKRFLVDDGVGSDPRFWKLADNLNKLYPTGVEERRWVEGVLARKKGLGF